MVQRLHDPEARDFASDNYAGAHPEILAALAAANGGHQPSYGADAYTARLQEVARTHFGPDARVFPVFTGTGANVLSLQAMLPRWGGAICAASAHINTDENGAPERVGGIKLLPVPTPDGKLTPELIDREAHGWGEEHRAQPLAVSITESTELGTCYTPDELRAVTSHAHDLGMRVHMDGARLANAAARLDVPLSALTSETGIDVVSFGGTKNGLLFGEAIVIVDPDAVPGGAEALGYLRKIGMQLASKQRFLSAQLLALFEDDLWLRSARHANAMADRMRAALERARAAGRLPGLEFTQPTEANAIFAVLPPGAAERLREHVHFYDWDAARGEVRWMFSWDTTEADVDAFADAVVAAAGGARCRRGRRGPLTPRSARPADGAVGGAR